MEQKSVEEESQMSSHYEMIEDNRKEFPELLRVSLGPVSTEYFGGYTFEIIPPNDTISAVLASYVIDRGGVFSVKGRGPDVISQGNPADARVLALVTALSGETVVIAPGTLRAEAGNRWCIDGGVSNIPMLRDDVKFLDEMSALAKERRHGRKPTTFVATRSGEFPSGTDMGLFNDEKFDAFIVTTKRGEKKAKETLSGATDRVLVFGDEDLDQRAFLSFTRARGVNHLSLQGGKQMFEPFVTKGLVSELLLSVMNTSVKTGEEEEKTMLFPNGASVPSREARLVTARHAEGITLRNYDMRDVRAL